MDNGNDDERANPRQKVRRERDEIAQQLVCLAVAQLSIEGRARPPRLQLSCVKELQGADTEKKKKKKKALLRLV